MNENSLFQEAERYGRLNVYTKMLYEIADELKYRLPNETNYQADAALLEKTESEIVDLGLIVNKIHEELTALKNEQLRERTRAKEQLPTVPVFETLADKMERLKGMS